MAKQRREKRDVRGWVDRVLLSVMGPPQLGDVSAPLRELPPAPVELCPRCHQPRDDHEVVRSPTLTYTRCPGEPTS
jgi:hypothetical protein